jgi:3-hydroxyisobutyrate dehydrogenase-like beta-hydroxyacid dehydrogenase
MTRVAFLGLGIMGSRMAANVARAGFELTVWNRTTATAERFCSEHEGVRMAATPAEAASAAEIVITMVVDGPQVEQVLLGKEGAADGAGDGTLFVDCSTIGPTAALAIGEALSGRGHRHFLDAPVTGSSPRAEDGTLTIMAGGTPEDFARAKPLFEAMGELIVHCGPEGHGQMVKLLNNALAATNAAALAQAIDAAERYGLDTDRMLEVMSAGSAKSTMLDLKARPMIERDYDPLFKLEHMLKDVRHCLAEAEALGQPLNLVRDAEALYAEAAGAGFGEQDFAAVAEVARHPNGAPSGH